MGDASDEDLSKITRGFLLASPPGEFMEVVTDVRALVPSDNILNDHAAETFREYNTDQMLQVTPPGCKHQVLITKHGEVADGEYLDPRGNQVITFDHIKQSVTGTRPISDELDSSVENFRQAFDAEASKYTSEHYPSGASTVYAKKEGGQTKIIIALSSSKFNPNNFYNGRWRSTWTISFGASGQASLEGKMQVNVHYYEDGNVQLNTVTEKKVQSPVGDASSTASNAIKAITKAEQAFHASLDQSYVTMGDTTFKALRRALPITRTKIDWQKIRNYKLGSEMGK